MRLLNVGVGVGPNVLLTSDGDTVLSGLDGSEIRAPFGVLRRPLRPVPFDSSSASQAATRHPHCPTLDLRLPSGMTADQQDRAFHMHLQPARDGSPCLRDVVPVSAADEGWPVNGNECGCSG